MSRTNLFQSKSIGQHLQDALDRTKREIAGCETSAKLDTFEAGMPEGVTIEPIKLDRSEAEFSNKVTGNGQEVSVSIPFEGDFRLFNVGDRRAYGRDAKPLLTGAIESGGWGDPTAPPLLVISQTFGVADDSEVRQWAKDTVDAIESELAEQRAVVVPHNARALEAAKKLVAERRAVLESAEALRGSFNKGI